MTHWALRSNADVDRLRTRPAPEQAAKLLRQAAGGEGYAGRRVELGERPPADLYDPLGAQLVRRQRRCDLEPWHANHVVALGLAIPATDRHDVRPDPDAASDRGAELQAELLTELASEGRCVVLTLLEAASGRRPHRAIRELEAHEHDPVGRVEHERADRSAEPHATSSRSARNQRRRSSHDTAAFAGAV